MIEKQQPIPILPTKLYLPLPRPDQVPRPRLLEQLNEGLSRILILVSAPAGSGKTTLVGDWVQGINLRTAWLSLDEADNDPTRFLQAFIAALQGLHPAVGVSAQSLLVQHSTIGQTPVNQGSPLITPLEMVIGDILEFLPGPFILVLDDFHLIREPGIHLAMNYLLDHFPTQPTPDGQMSGMRLVIITREDPPLTLPRLRALGQLYEVRLDDLRFTAAEAASFMNEHNSLNLTPDDLATLRIQTEGWAAGLRILAASLHRLSTDADRTAFIEHLTQTGLHVFEYLAEEVLDKQEPELRRFLLETSILPELKPALCDKLTGRQDSAHLLEKLYRRALFISATDISQTAYHYHALFAEYLRQRLTREMPERIPTLHRRAAEAHPLSEQAIAHYLAAELWLPAAQCIAALGDLHIDQGLLETVHGWLQAIPPSVRDDQSWLVYLQGRIAWQRGDFPQAETLLAQALAMFEHQNDTTGIPHALVHLSGALIGQYDFRRAQPVVERALSISIRPQDRLRLLQGRAYMLLYQGDWQGVRQDILESIRLAEGSGELAFYHILMPSLGGFLVHLPGMIDPLEQICRQALERLGDTPSSAVATSLNLLGYIRLLRGQAADSEQLAGRTQTLIEQLGDIDPWIGMDRDVLLTFHTLLRGDFKTAAAQWQAQMPVYAQSPASQPWLPLARYFLARSHWQAGEVNEVRRLTAEAGEISGDDALPESMLAHLFLRALQAMADQQYPAAEQLLREAGAIQEAMPHTLFVGSAHLWLAYLYEQWDRPKDAIFLLDAVLAECQQAGVPGFILREGPLLAPLLERMAAHQRKSALVSLLIDALAQAGKPKPVAVPGSSEKLTLREVEVLRLLASGASNQEIALQLVVTVSTAKAHVSNLLAKLGVSSRSAAVARARELRLI